MTNVRALGVLAVLALTPAVRADHLLMRKMHVDGYQAGDKTVPGSDSTHAIWLGKDRVRIESDENTLIVRMDQSKVYVLDPKAKTASTIELPFDMKKYVPPEMASMVDQMKGMMSMSATVTPSDETKKVGSWNAKKYAVTIKGPQGPVTTEDRWVTKDITGIDVTVYRDMMNKMFVMMPGGEQIAEEMKKIDGIVVLTERTRTRGGNSVKSTEELTSVESKDAPAGTYDIPADYTEKPFDPMGGMKGGRPRPGGAGGAGGGGGRGGMGGGQ